ncbi:MAG: Do family serine endopeptidase [Cyclobacteriaceae bacterium]
MRRFGSVFMAAVLGSLMTVATFQWVDKEGDGKGLGNYTTSVPLNKVTYTVDEEGKAVPLDFTVAAEMVMPAVVHIRSTYSGQGRRQNEVPEAFRDFFGPQFPQQGPQQGQSAGSGVIINSDGYIVTNNHVVKDADEVEVALYDDRTYKARVIGTDPDTDIAVLKIEEKGLPFLSFVDSNNSKVGEWVLAVGNPFNLNSTVTAGIISAKGRSINILNRNTENGSTAIESFIQTDAAINPGNSGGALVNLQGGLLGINTAIASPTGSYSGYGFAVPSNIVSKIVEDLIEFGVVQRGWLGVSITTVNRQLVDERDLEVTSGAFISSFADQSSAKEAGLKEGDVVVRIDQKPIKSNTALIEYIGTRRPGDKVNITVNRGGKEITFPVVLKTREGKTGPVKREEREAVASLGMELEDVDGEVLGELGLEHGIMVKSLGNGKLARYTDIREGFIITRVSDKPVKSVKDFNELMKNKKPGELVILSGTYGQNPKSEYNYAFRK